VKCFFHPTEDALFECSSCGKPICGQCMRFEDDDRVVCPACTLEKAMDVADEDINELLAARHRMTEAGRRTSTLQEKLAVFNVWLVLALVLLIGAQLLMRNYIGKAGKPAFFDVAHFRELGDPGPEFTYILAKAFQYANDHGGRYPDKADDLYPHYLEAPPFILGTEDAYALTPIQGPDQFLLTVPKADRFRYRRLFATGDGILQIQ